MSQHSAPLHYGRADARGPQDHPAMGSYCTPTTSSSSHWDAIALARLAIGCPYRSGDGGALVWTGSEVAKRRATGDLEAEVLAHLWAARRPCTTAEVLRVVGG